MKNVLTSFGFKPVTTGFIKRKFKITVSNTFFKRFTSWYINNRRYVGFMIYDRNRKHWDIDLKNKQNRKSISMIIAYPEISKKNFNKLLMENNLC